MPSNSSSTSEIDRLNLEVQGLRTSTEFWDTWNIRILAIAGFAALLLVLTAIGVSTSNRALVRATDRLDKLRDAKTTADLRDKDIEIGKAQDGAAKAGQKAGEAELKTAQIAQENIELQAKVEEEKSTRVKLEASLAPREIPFVTVTSLTGSLTSWGPLKADGITCLIETVGDEEARRAGSNIGGLLKQAGWGISGVNSTVGANFFDGVWIWYRSYAGVPTPNSKADKSEHGAVLLAAFLLAHDWKEVRIQWVDGDRERPSPIPDIPTIPMNTIVVRVGFKPAPYFQPFSLAGDDPISFPDIQGLIAEMKQQKEQIESEFAKQEAQFRKIREDDEKARRERTLKRK